MKQNKIPRNEYIRKPAGKTNPYKHDVLYTNLGQWKYPGQVTRIPSNDITMQGVPYPVYGEDDLGYGQMMYPGIDYTFPGQYVTEIPMAQDGLQSEADPIEHLKWGKYIDDPKRREQHIMDVYQYLMDSRWNPEYIVEFMKKNGAYGSKNRGDIAKKGATWGWDSEDITDELLGKAWDDYYFNRKSYNQQAYGGDPSLPNITGHYQKGGGLTYEQWKKKYKLVESPDYNLKRAWELGYTPDAKGHLPTVDEETGVFLKTRNHPTLRKELDWYNSPAGEDFRNQNDIDSSGTYFKYIPKDKNILKTGGWLDQYQKKGEVPAYKPKTKEEYDFRNKMYNDSLSLANMSRKKEWFFPQNPNISKEEYERLRELEKTYPQYNFAQEQYNIDQKKGKTRDFKDYVTSYNIYSKDKPKSITGYDISEGNKEIDKKYEEAEKKYRKSWVDKQGRKHDFEPHDLKGNSGVESIYDPQTGTIVDKFVDYKYPENNFNLDIYNKYIKPTETEYKGSKNKKEHGRISTSSKSTGWYDPNKPKPKFKNTSNDEYISYSHEAEFRDLYPYPKQKILKPDPNAPQGEKMTMESYLNNISNPIERIIPRKPVFTNEPQELRQSLPINIPQAIPSKTSDKDFLRIFVNPAPERIPDPKSKKVKHLVSPPLKHGGWLDQYAEGGDDSAKKDPAPKTKRNFKIVDDPNDPAYKDFLIRKGLYEHSTIPNIHLRYESSWRLNDQQPFDMADFKEDYDVDRIKKNKSFTDESYGPYGSEVNQRSYTPEEFNRLLKRQAVSADEYDKDLVKKYPPASYQLLETYTINPYDTYYALNNDRTKYTKPTTKVIEDKIDRKALKEVYPDLTDKHINNYLKSVNQSPYFVTNVRDAYGNPEYVYNFEKDYTDADRPQTFVKDGRVGYLPEEIQASIKKDKYYLPVYNKPEDEYFLRKGNIDYLEPGKPELQDMNVEDAPFNLNFKKPLDYAKRQWDFSGANRAMRYYDKAGKLLYSDIPYGSSTSKEYPPQVQRFYESDYEREKTPMNMSYADWEKMLQNKEEGGSIGGDEFRRGGMYYGTPSKLKKKTKKYGTSKNIQSSINKIFTKNKLFTRNYDVFGPSGKNVYNPNSKYELGGGWLDEYQDGGSNLTVSQLWEKQTGTPWQEAKKKGLTTGLVKDNLALRERLLKGEFNNSQEPKIVEEVSAPSQSNQSYDDMRSFNEAFKVARSTHGPNYMFQYKGKSYTTNLEGELFTPKKEVIQNYKSSESSTYNKASRDNTKVDQEGNERVILKGKSLEKKIEEENKKVDSPYHSKRTVELEPKVWNSWDNVKQEQKEINKMGDAQVILDYHKKNPGKNNFVIVDKQKGLMHMYKPDGTLLFTNAFDIDTGANAGDAQTVTKYVDTNKDGKITEADKVNGKFKVNWEQGNMSTGAGKFYISNIDLKGYEGLPILNMMNESQYDNYLKTGNIENVATSFHTGYIKDDDTRVSNGCVRCNKPTLDALSKNLKNSSEVYILPEDKGNRFVVENGKLNFKVNSGKDYSEYADSKGEKQKGQGINRTEKTLNYIPIKINTNVEELKKQADSDTGWSGGWDDDQYNKKIVPFVNTISNKKKEIMEAAKINGDVYNDIAQVALGIFGTESNYGDEHSAFKNLLKATNKLISSDSSSPDYKSKYKTYGADETSNSVGLTQIRWAQLNKDELAALNKLGIKSNKDFMDPEKSAIATMTILGIRYNQQLNKDEKNDILNNLPRVWNNRANYKDRVKYNSRFFNLEQMTPEAVKAKKKEESKKDFNSTLKNINSFAGISIPKKQYGGWLDNLD